MALFIVDERAGFRPAGVRRFAASKGGHLLDDPRAGRLATVLAVEMSLGEAVALEQGMMLQNLGLMSQALGLGGFPNFARHEFGWFEALGFRMGSMPASRYLGAKPMLSALLGLFGRDLPVTYPLGLERDGQSLLRAYCPPHYPSMRAAVEAFVEYKFGPDGVFRAGAGRSAWLDPAAVGAAVSGPSEAAVAATAAYCDYIHRRYGRYFRPEALTAAQREHQQRWHGDPQA
jgi:hypothetical protein